ncbi:hypothetical protein [Salinicoccus halodurans]|uniref:Uncharacterized protein n=1 Tax=Salinicoccus halodurans TaxID=407035 RepID=A0A0F7HLQ1_9STAP|nr:hypothetical protein [Salinicoccus halodurans]AKG74939.1 hypothetical protein AAT16_12515 [Salinicoccus halodurans]SFK68114.1 hypothetical protein SAMN05216235_1128 [Salinicoccus halodurans]
MVDAMLEFMLGPMRAIGGFYFEYQMIFNPIIVGLALFKILFGKNKKQSSSLKEEKRPAGKGKHGESIKSV